MSAHVLLNLLSEFGKEIRWEASNPKYKCTNVRFYLSYDI